MKQTLLGNSLWLILASGLANFVLLLFSLTMVRVYGFAEHGKFIFYLSVITLFRLILDAGIGSLMTKQLGNRNRSTKEILSQGITWTAVLNLPIFVLIALRPNFIVSGDNGTLALFSLWFFAMLIENLAASIFNGLQAMHLSFLSSLIMEGTKLALITYLWLERPCIETFSIVANICVCSAALIVAGLISLKLFKLTGILTQIDHAESDFWNGYTFLQSALILWVSTASITLFPQIMTVIIKNGLSTKYVSFYNAMASWSLIGTVLLTPASSALFAWIARNEKKNLGHTVSDQSLSLSQFFRWTGIFALGCALVLLGAGTFILSLYGEEILTYSQVYALLVLAQLADYPRFFTTPLLSGGGQARASMLMEFTRFTMVLASCIAALFFGYGLIGVAFATFIVQLIFGIIRILHIHQLFTEALFPRYFRNLIAVLLGYGIFCWHFELLWQTILLFLIFILFSGIRKDDFKFFIPRVVKA